MGGALLHRIVRFGRALRSAGVDAGPGRISDFASALRFVDLDRRDDFYYAARATLLARPDQREAFDEVFARFWPPGRVALNAHEPAPEGPPTLQPSSQPGEEGASEAGESAAQRLLANASPAPDDQSQDDSTEDSRSPGATVMSFSAEEVLREKNFGDFTDDELEQARRLMERMRWQAARRLTRRLVAAARGRNLDLRRTMRRAFTTGGETFTWAKRHRKLKPRPLVLICDVSGSMERYSRLLLQFLHTVSHGTGASVETFVFATRLTRVTPSLKRRRIEDALERVSKDVTDWSGGTRTGEALARFNRNWSRRVLGRGAVVLIISDGWDRGDVDQLGREMRRLRRTSYRLMWLNPLLGSPNYRPLTRGMQAALPHLDEFLPVHNLNSLEALVDKLAALPTRRTADRNTRGQVQWIAGARAGPSNARR
ncbi:MAG: VWA domain-containing protein [Chloroflexi bacterium]|nr:VWA domain-containing protein [Chloroflexota bacterium]